ncbi:MAG: iron-containing alcohol dehydrogenase, partial [Desulfurococcales archaeon]|nr:iron-containing alcohol dehydrogenase [Desulfurococcales archaeon]
MNVPVAEALLDVVAREGAGSLLLAWDDAARFIVGDVSGELRSAGVDVVEYHVEGGCGGLGYPAARARELAGALEASGAELLVGLGSGCLLSLAKLAWLLRHRPTLEPGRILPGARLGVRGARPKLVAAPIGGAGREVDNAAVLEEEGRALAVITPEIVPS